MEQMLPTLPPPRAVRAGRRGARVVRVRGHYRLDGTYGRIHFRRLGPRAGPGEAGPRRHRD
jgi:hypothetical protein